MPKGIKKTVKKVKFTAEDVNDFVGPAPEVFLGKHPICKSCEGSGRQNGQDLCEVCKGRGIPLD